MLRELLGRLGRRIGRGRLRLLRKGGGNSLATIFDGEGKVVSYNNAISTNRDPWTVTSFIIAAMLFIATPVVGAMVAVVLKNPPSL